MQDPLHNLVLISQSIHNLVLSSIQDTSYISQDTIESLGRQFYVKYELEPEKLVEFIIQIIKSQGSHIAMDGHETEEKPDEGQRAKVGKTGAEGCG